MAKALRNENYILKTLHAMSLGYFITFVMGTIFKQIGYTFHMQEFVSWATIFIYLTGPAIGVSIGYVLQAKGMNLVCAIIAGAIGSGSFVVTQGHISLVTANPIGAYISTIIVVEIVSLIEDKTPFDILLIPTIVLLCSGLVDQFILPYIHQLFVWMGHFINHGMNMQPLLMSIVIAFAMGILTTSPLTAFIVASMLDFSDLAAGAMLAGCCSHMIGLAIMSLEDNSITDVLAVGLGTSMLQFKNIIKKPILIVAPIISSVITGMLSVVVFRIKCTSFNASLGSMGLVGILDAINQSHQLLAVILVNIVVPIVICWSMQRAFKKLNYMKNGDMKLTHL